MTRLERFTQSKRESRSRRHRAQHADKQRWRRLVIEALEDRRLLAGVGQSPMNQLAMGVLGGEGEGLVVAGNIDPVTISGRTFEDLNADGTDHGGTDPGLGDVTVELWQDGGDSTADFGDDGDDILFASAVAGIGGGFSILEVPAGTFYLRQVVPDGGVQTTSPVFHTITTESGVDAADQDFGSAFFGSIHGFKFEDIDGDGIYSPGIDQPMAGVLFTLTGTDGQGAVTSLTDTTDGDGYFEFTGLLPSVAGGGPGTRYTVTETVPAGWMLTTPTAFNSDLLSGQSLVAFEGQAMIPPPSYEELQKLVSSDRGVPNQYPEYGYSVAIDGNVAVVGARCAAQCRGAAYVLEFDGAAWSEVAKLTASDGADDDEFGLAVGISGDTIVVGAHGHDVGVGSRVGAAYVYLRPDTGWATTSQFDAKLSASDGASGNGFGWSVDISGDSIVVGAYGHKVENYQSAGAAYVFQRPDTGWTTTDVFDARLIASDPDDNHYFGWAERITIRRTGIIPALRTCSDGRLGVGSAPPRMPSCWPAMAPATITLGGQ